MNSMIKSESEIKCDVCKFVYTLDNKPLDLQEILQIKFISGYGSVFGENKRIEIDVCQTCFKEKMSNYIRISE